MCNVIVIVIFSVGD